MADSSTFGTLLRGFRVSAGLSQEQLAERAGLSRRGIADLERGARRYPYPDTIERVADALHLVGTDRAALVAARRRAEPHPNPIGESVLEPGRGTVSRLPEPLTSFVGRQQERADVRRLLETTRLVTLVGTGGVGKTRLALEIARSAASDFADGVWMAELATLTDPGLVLPTVAGTFDLHEEPGVPLLDRLIAHLGGRRLLLVLDNCEHLIDACAALVHALVRACAAVHILATSREPLGIGGETKWRVPSLALAGPGEASSAEPAQCSEAEQLFADRAAAARPGFVITHANASAVAQVCRRLDGVPLAIELAAARVSLLGVEQLAERLNDRLQLLSGGSRVAPPRQQTLRSAIDWSYDLLVDRERTLWGRVSVFVGGWTFEAAEAVCAGEGIAAAEVLDLLGYLVDKSLVQAEPGGDGQVRSRLLAALRQYARERLEASGDSTVVQQRHAAYYLGLAEEAAPHLTRRRQPEWLEQLEREHDNLRAAMRWYVGRGGGGGGGGGGCRGDRPTVGWRPVAFLAHARTCAGRI